MEAAGNAAKRPVKVSCPFSRAPRQMAGRIKTLKQDRGRAEAAPAWRAGGGLFRQQVVGCQLVLPADCRVVGWQRWRSFHRTALRGAVAAPRAATRKR